LLASGTTAKTKNKQTKNPQDQKNPNRLFLQKDSNYDENSSLQQKEASRLWKNFSKVLRENYCQPNFYTQLITIQE